MLAGFPNPAPADCGSAGRSGAGTLGGSTPTKATCLLDPHEDAQDSRARAPSGRLAQRSAGDGDGDGDGDDADDADDATNDFVQDRPVRCRSRRGQLIIGKLRQNRPVRLNHRGHGDRSKVPTERTSKTTTLARSESAGVSDMVRLTVAFGLLRGFLLSQGGTIPTQYQRISLESIPARWQPHVGLSGPLAPRPEGWGLAGTGRL